MKRLLAVALAFLACIGQVNAGDVFRAYTTSANSGNVTFTATSPTVVTAVSFTPGTQCSSTAGVQCTIPVFFSNSGGALPGNITARTPYYVVPTSISADGLSFTLATTAAKALSNIADVNASDTGSGTQSVNNRVPLTSAVGVSLGALNLTVGSWRCNGSVITSPGSGTTTSSVILSISSTEGALGGMANNGLKRTQATVPADGFMSESVGPVSLTLTRPSIQYLNLTPTFAVSTLDAFSVLQCEKVP